MNSLESTLERLPQFEALQKAALEEAGLCLKNSKHLIDFQKLQFHVEQLSKPQQLHLSNYIFKKVCQSERDKSSDPKY